VPDPINLYDAKAHLSSLVERAAAGEEIIIAKAGKPRARLVPLASARPARVPGGWKGKVWIADDFDAPLPPTLLAEFAGEATPPAPSPTQPARPGERRRHRGRRTGTGR
jgi:prevent-host-death family protein